MKTTELDSYFDFLVEYGIATEEEIILVLARNEL